MILSLDSFGRHHEFCEKGHSASSTIASIQAAFAADPQLEKHSVTIRMLGPVAILEGYIVNQQQRAQALHIAEEIVGGGRVLDRMFCRTFMQ